MKVSLQIEITTGTSGRHKTSAHTVRPIIRRIRQLEAMVANIDPVKQIHEALKKETGETSDTAYDI